MKSFAGFCSTVACVAVLFSPQLDAATWITDLNVAKDQAARQIKLILLDFTGSDWCGWCKKLKGEVFDQAEFETYADQNLILVEVDFPQSKPITEEQRRANEALASRFKVQGYPTLVVLNAAGNEVG